MRRVGLALALAASGCVETPAPIDIGGVVYDPERLWLGEPAGVAGAQVYLAEDDSLGALSGDGGAYLIQDVPANFNWHAIAVDDPVHLRTIDGLGTPITDSSLAAHFTPILRRGGLPSVVAAWLGIDVSDVEASGLIVAAVMDGRPPEGRFLFSELSVSVGGDACAITWGFVTHDGKNFAVAKAPSGTPPEGWTGMLVAVGPLGCIVTTSIRDLTGQRDYLPHDMPIDNRAVTFQIFVPR
ncbi:MAG: hypothetical protein AABZ30_03185 [Myxococcota bacterium]